VRFVYYSLANFPHDSRERQWIQSIRSLRLHNATIPVWLLLFNGASDELLTEAKRCNVQLRLLGDYQEFLQKVHLKASILALYPTFHKFLVLGCLPLEEATQILYLDCDTFFFGDVNLLFARDEGQDWYAREEFRSRRSPLGYDPNHVDEQSLQSIARGEGLNHIQPFNSGVCLLNRNVWNKLESLHNRYLDTAWRLLCGRELNRGNDNVRDQVVRQAVLDSITDLDRSRALPYPSRNDWIIEQIALWLVLGQLPSLSVGNFSPTHVAQGGEFETMIRSNPRCIVAHYFTSGEKNFFAAVSPIAD